MGDVAELPLLQGYAVTAVTTLAEQAIPTQGYAASEGGPISVEGRLVVNQTGAAEQS